MECMTACSSLCYFITALGCLTLAKTARRRLRPPGGAFSGLEPPLPAYTGFIQMRAAKSASVGYYTDSACRIPAQMYTILFWPEGSARTDSAPSWAHSASRALRPERGREASTAGSRKKSDNHSLGELMESKTKLI